MVSRAFRRSREAPETSSRRSSGGRVSRTSTDASRRTSLSMDIHAGAGRKCAGRAFTAGAFRQGDLSVGAPSTSVARYPSRLPLGGGSGCIRGSSAYPGPSPRSSVDGLRSYKDFSEAVIVRHRADVPYVANLFALVGEGLRAAKHVRRVRPKLVEDPF